MNASIINKKSCVKFLCLVTVFIYIVFLFIDILYIRSSNIYSTYLKYATIVICFIISLFIGKDGYGNRDVYLIIAARFATLVADYFLVLYGNYYLGILCFCEVQIIYITRHTLASKYKHRNFIVLIVLLLLASVLLLSLKLKFISKQVLDISLIYAALLISSLYCAVITVKRGLYPRMTNVFIAIGMFMFFLCDINVGVYNIIQNNNTQLVTSFLIWFFYLPSQLLLSLSGFNIDYLKHVFLNKG